MSAAATAPPCVVVTTYARPDSLALLLDDVDRESPSGGLELHVYDDGTPSPDARLEARLRARGWKYTRAAATHGKRGWWRWWNSILGDLRRSPARLFYVLQDDMRLCTDFFARSAELWAAIDDPRKASLYLHLTAERGHLGGRCWTPVRATSAGRVVDSGWVDCAAFLCDRRLFDALDWRLHPISARRWRSGELVSSGVGQQISTRAYARGLGLYRVERSLTVHDGSPSLMNAEARRRWPMRTVGFIDGDAAACARMRTQAAVFASLASIPSRERGLERVVEALLQQVESLGVYLNGYDRVPEFLDDARIVVARSQASGLRGDEGKFFWAGTTNGYHLVCDDDIDYPPDYVDRLVDGIERHGRRAVVGFHGAVLRDEVADYHVSRRLLHFASGLDRDTPVHVLGTGVAGYHTAALRVRPSDFRAPNMADIWLALLGQRRRIPFVCLRRPAGWLRQLPGLHDDSIYLRARRRRRTSGPGPETLAVRRRGRWELHEPPGGQARGAMLEANCRPRQTAPGRPARSQRVPARPLVRLRVEGPQRTATLVLPARDHITEAIRRAGTYYERDLLDAIRERRPRGVFVDVGAHYGNHTTFFALECGCDCVVALEPNPPAFAGLLETVAENGLERVVSARHVAVHPTWRRVSVTALPWRPRRGASTRTNSGRVGIAPASTRGDAPAARLDELLDGKERIGVVKVDTEGLSAEILRSGETTLRRDRPLVAAEAATDAGRHALRALLEPLGYHEAGSYCWTPTWLWEPPKD